MPSGIEEEVVVGTEKPKRAKSLEMRAVFEPSRIAPLCVAQAYERVVPIARRGIVLGRDEHPGGRDEMKQQRQPGVAR
jgi:hypothetical protein